MNIGQQSFAQWRTGLATSSRCTGFGNCLIPTDPSTSSTKIGCSPKPLSSSKKSSPNVNPGDGTTNQATKRPSDATTRKAATVLFVRGSTPSMMRQARSIPMTNGGQLAYGVNSMKLCRVIPGPTSRKSKFAGQTYVRNGNRRVQSHINTIPTMIPCAPCEAVKRVAAPIHVGIAIQNARSVDGYQDAPFKELWKGTTQVCTKLTTIASSNGSGEAKETDAMSKARACNGQICA
mmetsp:Transcript_99190/g.276186  ORF Transcript_99190/g.276186 Transcript_99190/m.276186 type:complete len:234 (-) Transcript_99190:796-1497(-)